MELSSAYKHLKGGCQEDGARLFPVVPSDGTRSNRHKLNTNVTSTCEEEELLYIEGGPTLEQVEHIESSSPETHLKSSWLQSCVTSPR